MGKVYFVERLNESFEYGEHDNPKVEMILFDATEYNSAQEGKEQELFRIEIVNKDKIDRLVEGDFIYILGEKGDIQLSSANSSAVARRNVLRNNLTRGTLIKKTTEKLPSLGVANNVTSYHINVGHGNCSFIVIEEDTGIEVIAVDCANVDVRQRRSYQKNIDACISIIKRRYGINKFIINYMILTHSHFDHYSGICDLINKGHIDGSTIFVVNLFYSFPAPTYTKLLTMIQQLNARVIEPVSSNSTSSFIIHHPISRMVKSARSRYFGPNVIVEAKPNNSSVVTQICILQKSFLFPGDAETDAWDRIVQCWPHYNNCDIIAISHHGSINGHNRSSCPAGQFNNSFTIADCCSGKSLPLLMGRTGAFTGIPSAQVINDFGNVIFSEHDSNNKQTVCVELNWNNKLVNWHY